MSKTVLIVDDEPDIRELLREEFQLAGFDTIASDGGNSALQIAKSQTVDLVISDIRMPNGDGVWLLKELRRQDAFLTPVVLITGFADIGIPEAYGLGADAIFMKPFKLKALVRLVEKLLRKPDEKIEVLAEIPSSFALTRKWNSFPGERTKEFTLGRGGFYLKIASPHPKRESELAFDLQFGGGQIARLLGKGIVRWSDLNGVWIEITALTPESRQAFNAYALSRRGPGFIPLPA